MSSTRCNIFGAFVAVFLAGGAVVIAAETAPATRQNYQERYGVLSDRNIFLRERGRPAPTSRRSDSSSRSSTPRPVESTYVLTGIVLEDGQYRAYIEEVGSGRVQRLAVGDSVAKGHVLEIDIDAIAYSAGGQGTWVPIGCDLQGKPFNSFPSALSRYMSATSSTSRPSTQGAAPLPIDPNTANLSVEERMRLRRLQGK
jgi:hypothetical protein